MYVMRYIYFSELIKVSDWNIKIYTISDKKEFESQTTYMWAKQNLKSWLNQVNSFNPNHEQVAFLILHEATEGIFSLINTWVGKNMLQTHVYLTKYDKPNSFEKISGDGLFACVWELEVINHERKSWMKHILMQEENPDLEHYLKDTIDTYL